MPVVDLQDFSVPELRELTQDIEKEIKKRQEEKRKHVLLEMRQLAAEIGMTVEDVLAAKTAKKAKPTRARGPIKYQNPDNPAQTWTGRGKRPGWMKDALEAGKTREELEIQ